jgi:hypothetical protein
VSVDVIVKLIDPREADEGHVHIAWISGTGLPSFRIVGKRNGRWYLEDGRWGNGRRLFPRIVDRRALDHARRQGHARVG